MGDQSNGGRTRGIVDEGQRGQESWIDGILSSFGESENDNEKHDIVSPDVVENCHDGAHRSLLIPQTVLPC